MLWPETLVACVLRHRQKLFSGKEHTSLASPGKAQKGCLRDYGVIHPSPPADIEDACCPGGGYAAA